MTTAAEWAAQLALVSRLKTTYPEVPEWPMPDDITHPAARLNPGRRISPSNAKVSVSRGGSTPGKCE